jgi:type VI secretion system protein ImpG
MARLSRIGLSRLLRAASRFAREQPALAGMLGSVSHDPDAERMREGLFYLAATVLRQIDRFEADGHAALADIAAPDLKRPFPSATLVELTSTSDGVTRVESGAELTVRGNPRCRFQIVGGLDVGALGIEACRIESKRRLSMRFNVVARGKGPLASNVGDALRIYIDEPRDSALLLLSHVLSHTSRVELRRGNGQTLRLAGIRAWGCASDETLCPEPDGIGEGTSLVREYFLFPEKFLLLDVFGLQDALEGTVDTSATVIVRFDASVPERVLLTPEGLRAQCAPAVNLFRATAEPRVFEPKVNSFPLRVAGLPREEGGPYAVLRMSAVKLSGDRTPVEVPALRRFGAVPLNPSFPYMHSTKTADVRTGSEPEILATLTADPDALPVMDPHAISIDLLATNRKLGGRVRTGELCENGRGVPSTIRARNILPASPYEPPSVGVDFALRATQRASVPSQNPLRAIHSRLFSLVPSSALDSDAARALRERIHAVEQIEVDVISNAAQTRQGYRATLTIDESPFAGLGDVALFCRILHRLLDDRASLNRFFACEAVCTKSGARLRWPTELPR